MLPIAGPYNMPARALLPQPSIGVGADSADINAKQPGQNWSAQLVAQHSEYADDVIEGHTCDDECLYRRETSENVR